MLVRFRTWSLKFARSMFWPSLNRRPCTRLALDVDEHCPDLQRVAFGMDRAARPVPWTDFVSEFIKDKLWPRRRVAVKQVSYTHLDPPGNMTNISWLHRAYNPLLTSSLWGSISYALHQRCYSHAGLRWGLTVRVLVPPDTEQSRTSTAAIDKPVEIPRSLYYSIARGTQPEICVFRAFTTCLAAEEEHKKVEYTKM